MDFEIILVFVFAGKVPVFSPYFLLCLANICASKRLKTMQKLGNIVRLSNLKQMCF